MNRVFDCRGPSVPGAYIADIIALSPGDSAVRVAAAAAHLRPLHAPRLTHPHPHQVSLRGESPHCSDVRAWKRPLQGP